MPLARIIFAALRSRAAAAVLLVYQAVFLNVLLPGHTRGAITVDGRHAAACCDGGQPAGRGPAVPSRRDRDHCAVCQFAAGLTPVLFVRTSLAALGPLEGLPVGQPSYGCSLDLVPTYFACGPPSTPRV